MAAKALEIAGEYEDEGSLTKYLENLILCDHVKRTASDATGNEDALIAAVERVGEQTLLKLFAAYKADALMLRGDMEAAAPVVDEIEELVAKDRIPLPLQVLPPLMSIVSYNTWRYVSANSAGERARILKETRPVLKKIRGYGPKYMFRYAEALRLSGTFQWLAGKQRAALALWKEGLTVGKRLGLKPELGRINFEVAKRLSSPESKSRTLDALPVEAYARTARELLHGDRTQCGSHGASRLGTVSRREGMSPSARLSPAIHRFGQNTRGRSPEVIPS